MTRRYQLLDKGGVVGFFCFWYRETVAELDVYFRQT